MRTNRFLHTLFILFALLTSAIGTTWAQAPSLSASNILIQILPSGTEGNGSAVVTATEGSVSVAIADRVATLTVTPESGYRIKKDLIVVEKMVNPSEHANARRRAPGTARFDITGTDLADPNGWKEGEASYTFTIPSEYDGAFVTATFVPVITTATQITSLSDISDMGGSYVLTRDIDASDLSESLATSEAFTGTLDGGLHKIYNLSVPLFNSINGGTVKNVILEDVSISGTGNAGAFARQMTGTSEHIACIYNCGILSGSVSGDDNVGGLVGMLGQNGNTTETNNNCYARVINCYSYANITGGSVRAGIVGYNCYASKSGTGTIRSMVMNCMFYGDISSGGTIYPIYGGKEIKNEDTEKLNNYNYFRFDAPFSQNGLIGNDNYNRALAAEERYLVRFEFYRYLLNSNRELASWYVFGSVQSDAHTKMAKWVLDKSIAPYPILKEQGTYPSVVNYDPENTYDASRGQMVSRSSITERNKGKNLGTLTVNISLGTGAPAGASIRTGKSQITLKRTDKDYDNYNFNYDKVQLPYYNEVGTGNCTKNKVVTGWKITSMVGGTRGSFTASDTWDGYNFADRAHYAKDLYSESGRVFSQGAYFDVPDGVTEISIEPYWGTAAYLADERYDCYGYETSKGVTDFGTHYTNNTSYNICGDNQKVYTSFSNALSQVSGTTVYDNAIVLVGNYHQKGKPSEGSKAFTIMSADLDEDNEPDYCFIYNSGKGEKISPIRFDFVNVPGTAMAHKKAAANANSSYMGIMGNHKWTGWLEVTNTSFIRFSQLEYDNENKSGSHPVILLGGIVEQMVSTNGGEGSVQNTKYIHVGSNAWFKLFHNGCHLDKEKTETPHIPISVTGGDYERFYLSGYFKPEAKTITDDAECYISGGRFGEVAGAGQEPIKGNVTWLINHADITNFYGGGINDKKPIEGDISVTIKNSHVGTYCGGPKFGNMTSGKTVNTTATNCTFGTYFGAGYGGTAYYRYLWNPKNNGGHNKYDRVNYDWNGTQWLGNADNGFTAANRGKYDINMGIAVNFEYEHFEGSNDKTVARLYVNYASLSIAETNDVTSTLTGCTVERNFYGGGSLGKVNGDATSTLENCTVNGNVFGAGYSASVPTATVFDAGGFIEIPNYNIYTGVFEAGVFPDQHEFSWEHKDVVNSKATAFNDDDHILYTQIDLNDLGTVAGNVTLNITGNTLVEGKIFDENGDVTAQTGGVFGGGAQSEVTGADKTVQVNINQSAGDATHYINNVYGGGDQGNVASEVEVNVKGQSYVKNDVFGGGNQAKVAGTVKVEIEGTSSIQHNIYGGGNEADVQKTTTVNMKAGTVIGSIYGGGNLGDVGTIDKNNIRQYYWTDSKSIDPDNPATFPYNNTGVTHVNITGGTVGTNESPSNVFGGGKGLANTFWCEKGMVYSTNVSISNGTIYGSVYGGGELGRVETDTKVTIGPETGNHNTEIKGNVFGAGKGVDTHGYSALVRGNTEVIVQNGSKVNQNVYGGGEIASVGKYNVDANGLPYSQANNTSGNCRVNIPGTTQITGDIFGGGKGVVPDFHSSGESKSKRMVSYTSEAAHPESQKGTTWDYYEPDHNYVWEYFADNEAYLIYLQTLALATQTEVTIDPGATESVIKSTKGSVYGGSENGIVQHDTKVTISGNCQIGESDGSGNVAVNASGNVFGGGKGIAGNAGAGQVSGNATVNINNGILLGSVYGGGVLGATRGNVTVNINGGTVNNNVYGGGAYANTNTENWTEYVAVAVTVGVTTVTEFYEQSFGGIFSKTKDTKAVKDKTYYQKTTPTWTNSEQKSSLNKTQVNLRGGIIGSATGGDVYGGALGDGSHEPIVYGNILVNLNKETSSNGATPTTKAPNEEGCVVKHIFGCNNAKGTPKGDVMVHVYGTQNVAATHIANQGTDTTPATMPKVKGRYDVTAVYGGGNQAAYDPVDPATNKTQVIIEGCELTSIETVYGGGNAAPVPSTDVTVNSCYEIYTLFGGGNGSGVGNNGADVGIIDQTAYAADKTTGTYGPGTALVKLLGGEIHTVYGGSNEKGNIVGGATVNVNNESDDCELKVDHIYGAGNNAKMDGGTDIVLGCMPAGVIEEIYAGARNADVAGDVKLTLTSGKFGRVFGGNKHGGKLMGSITVNIEETGDCSEPLIIGELYGGGNLADYSVYGYDESTGAAKESGSKLYNDPRLNVHAFTSIGAIYGGGYRAKMVANPTVDINVAKGSHATGTHATDTHAAGTITGIPTQYKNGSGEIVNGDPVNLTYPAHEAGKIGTIGNVFGGGNLAPIIGNATVNIGSEKKIYFKTEPAHLGASAYTQMTSGDYIGLYEATVEGAIITGSVYGGGNEANVTGNTQVNICAKYNNDASEYRRVAPGSAGVTIDHDVFGAGKGDTTPTTAFVSGNTTIVMMGGEVKQSVYGGGELSQVGDNTYITISGGVIGKRMEGETRYGGEIYGNIYGGGKGNTTDVRSGLIMGNTTITVKELVATAGNADYYGVSAGDVVSSPEVLHNIYGGGALGSVGTYEYASTDADAAISSYTSGGAATINILGGTIGYDGHNNGMIFGSSRGEIDRPDAIYDRLAWVHSSNVVIGGEGYNPQIKGSVYGGGENGHTYQNASVAIHSGMVGITETMSTDPNGEGGAKYPYRGNVYGAGCGTDKYYADPTGIATPHDGGGTLYNIKAGFVGGSTTVLIDGGHVVRDVYGAGSMGAVTGTTEVTIAGNAIIGAENSGGGYVFAAARGDQDNPDKATVGGTTLNISGGTIWESAFGGGQNGIVKGSVAVNVTGGVVKNDVYGGGALADTNTDNWNANATPDLYVAKTGLTIHKDNVTGSDVSAYYTRSGNAPNYTYTKASGEAQANTIYYEKKTDTDGGWVTPAPNNGNYYTTKVEISGGTVGNVYGGGLGRLANGDNPNAEGYIAPIKAMVYGDVTVTINGCNATGATNDAKFTQNYDSRTFNRTITNADNTTTQQSVTEKYYTTGRVFGCNNLNGTPKGNVNVTVWKTTPLGGGSHLDGKYEIQEVYGGGNLSAYTPAEGKKTEVHIHGCDDTSILYVFGGGNAATVPETDVNIHSCREIETVFGGGNGNEPVKDYSGQWVESAGADVPGTARLSLKGGLIHSAFAGSFVKGTCGMTVLDDSGGGSDNCTLKVTNMYGGGKDAPVLNGININISGCSNASNSNIENIYAGSYNARISNGITMNITGGIFKKVFGGNDQGGFINGPIVINVEETGSCKPIIIDNLYGSGNFAPYPGPGTDTPDAKITINIKSCTHIGNVFGGGYGMNAVVTGDTELNINMIKGNWAGLQASDEYLTLPYVHKSHYAKVVTPVVGNIATYYEKTGKTTYAKTNDTVIDPNKTYYTYSESEIDVFDDEIGSIGNVYGGGDLGAIHGNTIINIGNATQVDIMKRNADGVIVNESNEAVYNSENGMLIAGKEIAYVKKPVLGANITGNVYGGGNLADVTGNTYVNISALMTPVLDGKNNPTGEYTYSKVNHSGTTGFEGISIGASVYGGGNEADVLKNTHVQMEDGYVFNGIFGGGYSGSVGKVIAREAINYNGTAHTSHTGCLGGKPTAFADNTGKCTVVVNGGQIGPDEVATQGMNRLTDGKLNPVPQGWVWGAGCGILKDPADDPDTDFRTYVKETDVTIGGTAFIMESVIGGGEFGRVLGDTKVTIEGNCQIGAGYNHLNGSGKPIPYTTDLWTEAEEAVTTGTESDINTVAGKMPGCSHFPYGRNTNSDAKPDEFLTYDPYYETYEDYASTNIGLASTEHPSDGKTWIGCVFGGGSGYMPYKNKDNNGYDWIPSAGLVEGNTEVHINGGHILTNVYGGNEYTDVKGESKVVMTGGTIGVPRTKAQIEDNPLTGYLFGAGKGDPRSHFNTYTNVGSSVVEVSGGIIYGSVVGGSEDGHVLGSTSVTISGGTIGTWGTTYYDGNVFGGGRGFSGDNLIAGSVGGNASLTISGGKILGSVYGGGRLASVGINSSTPTNSNSYGQLVDDSGDKTYGHITINISGGTIGTETTAEHTHSGNVYGGSMGRIKKLDGTTTNELWPKLAVAKTTSVSISGTADIKNNVYGGGEIGIVRNQATVNVSGGTINGNVYGSGYGSNDYTTKTTITPAGYAGTYYTFIPMLWAGCASGNTNVYVSGGTVKKNVYGGGELASVGLIDFVSDKDGKFTGMTKHEDVTNGFGLSWPYEFHYHLADALDASKNGKATVTITDGRIEGYVFGGSKGNAYERYTEAFCANVRETEVNINYSTTPASTEGSTACIVESVYGGGEDGHVYENSAVNITGGLIGTSVYGGGKGHGVYSGKLYHIVEDDQGNKTAGDEYTTDIPSWTAGKVYGNTSVNISGGHVLVNVYGGGNLASVGKGNYASGADDYYPAGYGEKLAGNLWDNESDNSKEFLRSGKSSVSITAGTIGSKNTVYGTVDGKEQETPTGMVFGGSRGKAAEDVGALSPRYEFAPDFFLGYVNNAEVTIGNDSGGPTIYSQVFGGGRDGHVRGNTHVIINNGTIGQLYTEYNSISDNTKRENQRRNCGNVYGAGSGMGLWSRDDKSGHGTSSGSVTLNTTVDVYGGTIYGNVYGGGAMASVGPPKILMPDFAPKTWSKCTVNIHGGTIGYGQEYNGTFETDYDKYGYGGCVFGASRGSDFASGESFDNYATTLWNDVNINGGSIAGDVYGGGQASRVKKSADVNMNGGTITHDAYGGGQGTLTIAADLGGDTSVKLNENKTSSNVGCIVRRIFGCNNLNGTPKGHASVHVYATQHRNTTANPNIGTKYAKYGNVTNVTIDDYSELTTWATTLGVNVTAYTAVLKKNDYEEITGVDDTEKAKKLKAMKEEALESMRSAVSNVKYDVESVYGGGNLAAYEPTNLQNEVAQVVIDGCDLTSINHVYGGGNAAYTPSTSVRVNGTYEIDEVFGGGNGKDIYSIQDVYYENLGANVGYKDLEYHVKQGSTDPTYNAAIHGSGTKADPYKAIVYDNAKTKENRQKFYKYGAGVATTIVTGGRIHSVYGGSNKKGNISYIALSQYQESGGCDLIVDRSYGAGKDAVTDAETKVEMDCVKDMSQIFGGSTNADVYNDITLTITNGTYHQVFGGNDTNGAIFGSITVNIEESGCQPIEIDELYGGGYLAPYSIYGYETNANGSYQTDANGKIIPKRTGTDPKLDPIINIISATRIGNVYGGGYQAEVVGSPHINVNMKSGYVLVKRKEIAAGDANNYYYTYVEEEGKIFVYVDARNANDEAHAGKKHSYDKTQLTLIEDNKYMYPLSLGYINNVFGGGNEADITGNTFVDIGTSKWLKPVKDVETDEITLEEETLTRNKAVIKGNVYGGGRMGSVGNFTKDEHGKPVSCAEGTGECHVTISNGSIGPDNMSMFHLDESGNVTDEEPDNAGHVFGGGQGTLDYYYDDNTNMTDAEKVSGMAVLRVDQMNEKLGVLAFCDSTEVIINGTAFVKGSVFGGAENGHVLHNAGVKIGGDCQIGNGHILITKVSDDDENGKILINRGLNRPYTAAEWAAGHLTATADDFSDTDQRSLVNSQFAASLPECDSWLYGKEISGGKVVTSTLHAPHDIFANKTGQLDKYSDNTTSTEGGRYIASDGHAFNGSVYGGGSGYFPYAPSKWLDTAGKVEGDTWVEVTGGHILTSLYGGCEMTSIGGDAHVIMSGGTVGVPRTLAEIAAHPVTCYVYGGGKGEERIFFNKNTNVRDAFVNITGGWVYGSVFGGGEDGHVLRHVTMNISEKANPTYTYANLYAGNATKIGTWGTSYVDGNIFGGGRGFAGDAYTAGNVAGSVKMTINGGTMLGSIYGGGRLGSVGYGLFATNEEGYGKMRSDNATEEGFSSPGFFGDKGRGHIDITINGGTIGNNDEYKLFTFDVDKTSKTSATIESEKATAIAGFDTNNIPNTVFELDSVQVGSTKTWHYTYRLSHTKGGNIFAGGMGRLTQLDGTTPISAVDWWKLGNVKSTKLTINGGTIKSNVYGGCELGMVQGTHTSADSKTVSTEITISGGTIGTEIQNDEDKTQYTFGSVFGGGYGSIVEKLDHSGSTNPTYTSVSLSGYYFTYPKYIAGRVKGSTEVTMTGGAVKASVYGGGEMAAVGESKVLNTDKSQTVLGETLTGAGGTIAMDGHTYVTVSGGTIGIDKVGDKLFGGATMGNVYGGGSGYINTVRSGQVYGNTNVTIKNSYADAAYHEAHPETEEGALLSSPRIYHNVYGGGAYGTVGDFTYEMTTEEGNKKVSNIIGLHNQRSNTGTSTVTITGGTFGVDGHENGMIFGSSRGEVDEPGKRPDWLAWVNDANVTIGNATDGTNAGGDGTNISSLFIKGSVYGSGENGHTYHNTLLNIHSGTIGNTTEYYAYRGNVYGGGCGTDQYDSDGDDIPDTYNPTAGIVRGNTTVNIDGGVITGGIYGAGAMASVGDVTSKTQHHDITGSEGESTEEVHGLGLSWPYKFVFREGTGKATINITGGHIGITGTDGGDVYGSARGEAGDRYTMAHYAYVKDTEVNINLPITAEPSDLETLTKSCITGAVQGSGENGYVYGDTHVTLDKGLIAHSLYGGGKGKGTYKKMLPVIIGSGSMERDIYGLLSGKVLGNTYVTMKGGHVMRNVYGGGNMGSVGKGNYAGGDDDYYPEGYGETLAGHLWTTEATEENPDDAWEFLNSGKTNVKVLGGTVGYIDRDAAKSIKNNLPYGNVIGGSAGEAAPNIDNMPRYLYSPAFFSGYVNETDVVIGKARAEFDSDEAYEDYLTHDAPTILASVYGGGQDGHVRRDTKVTVNSGTIGVAYGTNVITIKKVTKNEHNEDVVTYEYVTDLDDPQWLHRGNVYGGGSGISMYEYHFNEDNDFDDEVTYNGQPTKEKDYSSSSGSVARFTEVKILGGTIHRNVYGGGSLGSVGAPQINQDYLPYKPGQPSIEGKPVNGPGRQSMCTVIIGGAGNVTIGSPIGYQKKYGGEVFGACRGVSNLDENTFGTSIWTLVKILNGANVQGNVFGGGDNGIVKMDTDVQIGGDSAE